MPAGVAGQSQAESRRLSWPVTILTLAAITSSSMSALSLYHTLALKAEVEVLRTEVNRRREEQGEAVGGAVGGSQQQRRSEDEQQDGQSPWKASRTEPPEDRDEPSLKKWSPGRGSDQTVFQPCLQMMADSKRNTYQKEFALNKHVAVPWYTGLKRGSALEGDQDDILVKEEGYYYIYSQVEHYDPSVPEVFYKDPTYAMGHIVFRTKTSVVGDENKHVVLFRCIQNMDAKVPYNTCFTGGVVKLEAGDRVELLIPRSKANISLDGDATFLGAVKLA